MRDLHVHLYGLKSIFDTTTRHASFELLCIPTVLVFGKLQHIAAAQSLSVLIHLLQRPGAALCFLQLRAVALPLACLLRSNLHRFLDRAL